MKRGGPDPPPERLLWAGDFSLSPGASAHPPRGGPHRWPVSRPLKDRPVERNLGFSSFLSVASITGCLARESEGLLNNSEVRHGVLVAPGC